LSDYYLSAPPPYPQQTGNLYYKRCRVAYIICVICL